jgi:DNA invertase Pin-like site-specific DNA recombinase
VDLVVLDQGIDTSTAMGRMFFHILGAVAEFSVISTRRGAEVPALGVAA